MSFVNYTGGRYVVDNGQPVTFKMGPFVSPTDGKTPVTSGLIFGDVVLSKNDGSFNSKSDNTNPVHTENGWFDVTLNGTDTNTQGNLIVYYPASATNLAVWMFLEVKDGAPA